MLSSDSDDDDPAQLNLACDVLQDVGLDVNADDVPILLLPEPILYLIMQGEFSEVMFLLEWHSKLYNSVAQLPWSGKQLFSGISWPPYGSCVWERVGAHETAACPSDMVPMNSEDSNTQTHIISTRMIVSAHSEVFVFT